MVIKKKKYSISSIQRVISLYKGIEPDIITEINLAYQDNDFDSYKKLINQVRKIKFDEQYQNVKKKPKFRQTIDKQTLNAYARLSFQYLNNVIRKPTKINRDYIFKHYGLLLLQNDYKYNLNLLNGKKEDIIEGGDVIKPPEDNELLRILSRDGLWYVEKKKGGYKTTYDSKIIGKTKSGRTKIEEIEKIIKTLYLNRYEVNYLKNNGLHQYQMILRCVLQLDKTLTKIGRSNIQKYAENYISTGYVFFNNINSFFEFLIDIESYVVLQAYYDWQEVFIVFDYIKQLIVYWKR